MVLCCHNNKQNICDNTDLASLYVNKLKLAYLSEEEEQKRVITEESHTRTAKRKRHTRQPLKAFAH